MKTNVVMKIAVVFMAAFGAYAFSGSANSQNIFTRSDTCENITAECSTMGEVYCQISVNNKLLPVFDLGCTEPIKHIDSAPVSWH